MINVHANTVELDTSDNWIQNIFLPQACMHTGTTDTILIIFSTSISSKSPH